MTGINSRTQGDLISAGITAGPMRSQCGPASHSGTEAASPRSRLPPRRRRNRCTSCRWGLQGMCRSAQRHKNKQAYLYSILYSYQFIYLFYSSDFLPFFCSQSSTDESLSHLTGHCTTGVQGECCCLGLLHLAAQGLEAWQPGRCRPRLYKSVTSAQLHASERTACSRVGRGSTVLLRGGRVGPGAEPGQPRGPAWAIASGGLRSTARCRRLPAQRQFHGQRVRVGGAPLWHICGFGTCQNNVAPETSASAAWPQTGNRVHVARARTAICAPLLVT